MFMTEQTHREKNNPQRRHDGGFMLLEVLIAMMIFAIGFLGLAKLQVESLRHSTHADMRSKATVLAMEIIDRMRSNRSEAMATSSYVTNIGEAENSVLNCIGGSSCNASQMALFDLDQWKTALSGQLPAGDGAIVQATNGDGRRVYTVTVQWDNARGTGALTNFSLTTEL